MTFLWFLVAEAAAFILRITVSFLIKMMHDRLENKASDGAKPTPYPLMTVYTWLQTIAAFALTLTVSIPVLFIIFAWPMVFCVVSMLAVAASLVYASVSLHATCSEMRDMFHTGPVFDALFAVYLIFVSYNLLLGLAKTNHRVLSVSAGICNTMFFVLFFAVAIINIGLFIRRIVLVVKEKHDAYYEKGYKDAMESAEESAEEKKNRE